MKIVLRYAVIFPKKCYNTLKVLIQVDLLETGYHFKFFVTAHFLLYLTKFSTSYK